MKRLKQYLQNSKPFQSRLSRYREISDPNMTQNRHICAICCRPEVDCGDISGRNVRTIVVYILVNLEIASSSRFQDNREQIFPDEEVGGGINAICS